MVVTGELTALEAAYRAVYVGALIFLALMIFLCLIRAVKGPSIADRIVAVNMMGTMVMVIIAILALMLKEGYLPDLCDDKLSGCGCTDEGVHGRIQREAAFKER